MVLFTTRAELTDPGPAVSSGMPRATFFGVAGATGGDIVFKLEPSGQYTVLKTFTGPIDGGSLTLELTIDPAGKLYGTTTNGGTAGVILDPEGNFYGTNPNGGTSDYGDLVYKVDATGQETVLFNFDEGVVEIDLQPGVVRDGAGNLYGTTYNTGNPYSGIVYKVDATGHATVLHRFTDSPDGYDPESGLILDAAGNLYETTYEGGREGSGSVYKVDPSGLETILYSFGPNGYNPYAGVALDAEGNLYGTT